VKTPPIYIIVAVDENNGIGKDGKLPWHFSKELKYFQKTTAETSDHEKQNAVIMGRKTWESISPKYRPLKNRQNIVMTRDHNFKVDGAKVANSLEEAISLADNETEKIFIIGGGKVFEESLENPQLDGIYLTKIQSKYDCDTFFPDIPSQFNKTQELGEDQEDSVKLKYTLHEK